MQRSSRFLKISVLLFTILIPVLIYLFLKGFGDNQFTVPVYYESGIDPDTTDCISNNKPHRINWDTFFSGSFREGDFPVLNDKLTIFDLNVPGFDRSLSAYGPLQRVYDIFRNYDACQIMSLWAENKDTVTPVHNQNRGNIQAWLAYEIDDSVLTSFAKCGLILLDYSPGNSSWNKRLVLVDDQQRIRGYYNADDFDEIERLILETKIILDEEY